MKKYHKQNEDVASKNKEWLQVHSTARGPQVHSLHSLHIMLVWLCSGHTGLQHVE